MTESGRIGDTIAAAVGVAVRRRWIIALIVLSLAAAGLTYAVGHLRINTDTADMISSSLDWRQDFEAYRASFPTRDRNIVAVVDGPNGEASLSFARDLAERLAAEPGLFPTVFLAGAGQFFEQNGLLYLPLDELERLADRLIDAQPLLGRLADDVTGAGLLTVLRESIERSDARSPAADADLDRIFDEIALTIAADRRGESRPIAWGGLIGATAETDTRQLVLIKPTVNFNLVRPAREAIERIREIGGELTALQGDDTVLRLTGTLAMEHEELSSITQSATVAGIAALVLVVIVLLWALRSAALLVISVVVLLSGLSMTAAFAALAVEELNLLSVAFAVLYIGLGVDFVLHISLRLEELRARGVAIDTALIETARGVGSSIFMCAVTTAAGFFAFIPTDFTGVSELGLIAGVGMIISFLVSLTLLPALIRLFWRGRGARRATAFERRRVPRRALPARAVIGVAAVAGVAALLLVPSLRFDGNPIHLRDPDAESIRTLEDLAADSDAPIFDLAVLVPNEDTAESTATALASLDTVESVQTIASLVPSNQIEKLYVIDDLAVVLGSTLSGFERAEPGPERLVDELERLVGTLDTDAALPPEREALRSEGAAWLASQRSLEPGEAEARALALEDDLLGNLVDQVARLERGLRAEAFGRDDLPAELVARFVNDAGEELVEVTPREDLNDNEAAERFVSEVRSVAPNATGLPVVYQEAAATVTRAFAIALSYAFAIVCVLLAVFLRNVRDVVLVLVPIVFAAVMTAGVSVLIGLPLNFANIIALPLLVGVGVDSGIHMVHRMRTEPPSDGDPRQTSTSRAVLLSALTTIASFGNLAFSTHLGMASMGQLLTLGMLMSLVAVLGLLPAMLRLGKAA